MKGMLSKLVDALHLSPTQAAEKRAILEADMAVPARVIGAGQTGVGKTELLRSIFAIGGEREEALARLRTNPVKSETVAFFSFKVTTPEGFSVEFTDGPGLGESPAKDELYLPLWIHEVPKHDLLYWVVDGSSRDISHITSNMRRLLDATDMRGRFVVVLNKVDQILIPREEEQAGGIGWDPDFNIPSPRLIELIKQRTDDLIEKIQQDTSVSTNQIVVCSARRRWNHGAVLDKLIQYLPPQKRIKASRARDVKPSTELMSESGRRELAALRKERGS